VKHLSKAIAIAVTTLIAVSAQGAVAQESAYESAATVQTNQDLIIPLDVTWGNQPMAF